MTPTQLSIGDWVRDTTTNTPVKITTLDQTHINGILFYRFGSIPLTNHLLELNEFHSDKVWKKMERSWHHVFRNPEFFTVHELQHSLRLCGLDDLALTFKVD